ncbi:hypothetical protein Dimus_010972 [Dionaea muscipula]
MGLFENPMADHTLVDQLGSEAYRDLSREAVKKSLVLLKNGAKTDEPVLPLPKNRQDPSSRNPCQQPRQPMWWLDNLVKNDVCNYVRL